MPADQIAALLQNAATCEAGTARLADKKIHCTTSARAATKAGFKAAHDGHVKNAKKACADARVDAVPEVLQIDAASDAEPPPVQPIRL